MQRLKKNQSLVSYLMAWSTGIVVISMAILLVAITFITDRAGSITINNDLRNAIYVATEGIVVSDGVPILTMPELYKEQNIYVILLDKDGNYMSGAYSGEFDVYETMAVENNLREVKNNGNSFYVVDRSDLLEKQLGLSGGYVLRAYANVKDISTVYLTVRRASYLTVAFAVLLLLVFAIALNRKISKPMEDMCEKAEEISEDLKFAGELTYSGRFSELVTLIDAYNRLLKRMQEVVARQEQFNSDVSHELRTPITVIRLQCETMMIKAKNAGNTDLLEEITIVHQQTERMYHMMEQLLNLSRMAQNRLTLRKEYFDLTFLVESICEDENYVVGDSYKFLYILDDAPVFADMNLTMTAIRNLVSNAVKYSEPGSTITVTTGVKDDMCFLSVEDEGLGMTEEQLGRIFESYYRAEEARSTKGYGLGLTLMKKIVEYHDGHVEVTSSPGVGSTFTIYIPKYNEEEN